MYEFLFNQVPLNHYPLTTSMRDESILYAYHVWNETFFVYAIEIVIFFNKLSSQRIILCLSSSLKTFIKVSILHYALFLRMILILVVNGGGGRSYDMSQPEYRNDEFIRFCTGAQLYLFEVPVPD